VFEGGSLLAGRRTRRSEWKEVLLAFGLFRILKALHFYFKLLLLRNSGVGE
jgi:hypothetical protein